MDIFLLKLIGDWLAVITISVISFFGFGDYQEKNVGVENTSYTKAITVVKEVIPFETKYIYNPNKSADSEITVLVEGTEGLSYSFENGSTEILREPINKVVEIGTKGKTYTGRLTSYGGDCKGCSKTATVACKTREGKKHSLFKDGVMYNDKYFGEARIIAADLKGFPCGTIVLIDNGKAEPFMAVVLDTGATMRNHWAKGNVWIDLAFSHEKDIKGTKMDSKNATFTVQRWGW